MKKLINENLSTAKSRLMELANIPGSTINESYDTVNTELAQYIDGLDKAFYGDPADVRVFWDQRASQSGKLNDLGTFAKPSDAIDDYREIVKREYKSDLFNDEEEAQLFTTFLNSPEGDKTSVTDKDGKEYEAYAVYLDGEETPHIFIKDAVDAEFEDSAFDKV